MCDKQCQKQFRTVESECGSIGGCHINDRVDAINVEEKCQQEQEDFLLVSHIFQSDAQTIEAVPNRPWLPFHVMLHNDVADRGRNLFDYFLTHPIMCICRWHILFLTLNILLSLISAYRLITKKRWFI